MISRIKASEVVKGDVIPMRWDGVVRDCVVTDIVAVGRRFDIITVPPAPGRMLCSANESLAVKK